jgi:hypothetical protein
LVWFVLGLKLRLIVIVDMKVFKWRTTSAIAMEASFLFVNRFFQTPFKVLPVCPTPNKRCASL